MSVYLLTCPPFVEGGEERVKAKNAEKRLPDLADELIRYIARNFAFQDAKRLSWTNKDIRRIVDPEAQRMCEEHRSLFTQAYETAAVPLTFNRWAVSIKKIYALDPHLDLTNQYIRDEGAVAIARALRGNRVLTSLNVDGNFIGPTGATAIAEALRGNGVLKNLNLGYNLIGDEGAKAIGGALAVNGVLTSLDVCDNEIGSTGAAAIAEALRGNAVLTNLNLAANQIGDEGAKALASGLRVNGGLNKINLCYNGLFGEGKGAIRDAVSGRVGFELEM